MNNAFVTGSQVYGTPKPESDVDLAVVVSYGDLVLLRSLADKIGGSNGDSLVFGKLNLLCLGEGEFDAWKGATDILIAKKPVTREQAVAVIEECKDQLRK